MKINKQNNIYTIVYIVILVVIVGTVLSFTSMSLRSRQTENASADKMRQILAAVHLSSADDVIGLYKSTVIGSLVVNSEGDSIGSEAFDIDVAKENKKALDRRLLPVYIARIDGRVKYILPVSGNGLWGPIWGYVSFDDDGTTIYGAYFAHEGETPGLGAEIEKPAFSNQFEGKQVFKSGIFLPVNVLKAGTKPQNGEDYVDAVSGGTITSKGVASMLDTGLRPYEKFLSKVSDNNI